MRLSLTVLVTVHLLLRGFAGPCAHADHADVTSRSQRAHIHLCGAGQARPGTHGTARCGHVGHRGDGHAHHDASGDHLPHGDLDHAAWPDHDHDAVYLEFNDLICVAGGTPPSWQTDASWFALPDSGAAISTPILRPEARRVRPPGGDAPAIHTLLPHVLRV